MTARRSVLTALFASALVLAYLGGEWHGRRTAPERIVVQHDAAPSPCPDKIKLVGPGRANDCIVADSSGLLVVRQCP